MKLIETFQNLIRTGIRQYALAITDEGNLCIAGSMPSNPHEFKLVQIVKDREDAVSILRLWGAQVTESFTDLTTGVTQYQKAQKFAVDALAALEKARLAAPLGGGLHVLLTKLHADLRADLERRTHASKLIARATEKLLGVRERNFGGIDSWLNW
jgi:hypothetical protein